MICKNCGAECNDGVKFCVACGTPMDATVEAQPVAEPVQAQPVTAQPEKKPVNALAIVALVTGILSIVSSICCSIFALGIFSLLPGVAAIICGALAKKKEKNTMATVGLILGIAGLVIGVGGTILVLLLGFAGGMMEALYY